MKGKALLAGCIALIMSNAAFAEDIKIAVVGAMSGPVAQYGDQEFTGAEQAVADINAKGGIKGNKLQIVKYDDACDPKQAVAVANKVINDGIKYVIGHLCSSSTQPASDIYEDEGVLMITPAATAPELTARGYKMILRTTGLDSDQGPTAAKYIIEKVKPQRIAIVHDKQQYGEGLARAVQDGLKKGGANVVFFDGITAGGERFLYPGCAPEERKYRLRLLRRLPPGNGADSASVPRGRSENAVYGTGGRRQRLPV
ncbi:Leu/Ile/Val-binding protein precursor [Raoultella planticola]|uniref:Leu/Ile/Val-binding protein n=1 Tax=Raoultella planticola TaxID=575 RepID=A0A485CMP3_RAOPL|nr:Leu/Ile/Val-binding protein precursor [Raoultella planticola]